MHKEITKYNFCKEKNECIVKEMRGDGRMKKN